MALSAAYRISRTVLPAASLDLVTLAQAKAVLGIDASDTSQDAIISAHIAQVSAAINNYCDRIFVRQGYRDQFRQCSAWLGYGEPLWTRQSPIAVDGTGMAIAAVAQNGVTIDPAYWEVDVERGTFYSTDGGYVMGSWIGDTVVIDYTGGFDPIPADVEGAALEWLAGRYSLGGAMAGPMPGLRSETIPDLIEQTWSDAAAASSASTMPPGVTQTLNFYRKVWL